MTKTPAKAALPKMSENDLLAAVVELAQLLDWRIYHVFEQRNYARRIGVGFPDLFCVRGNKALALELKSDKGRVSDAQYDWLASLEAVEGIDSHVLRPTDWHSGLVKEILRGGPVG